MLSYIAAPGCKTIEKGTIKTSQYAFEYIMDSVCKFYGVSPEAVKSHSRFAKFVEPRHIIQYLLMQRGFSSTYIGQMFGRDHSSVLHAKKTIINALSMTHENQYKTNYLRIIQIL